MILNDLYRARCPVRKAGRPLFLRLCTVTCILFLLHSPGLVCAQLPDIEKPDGITNFTLSGQLGRFLEAQLFPAPVNATVPTLGALIFRVITWTSGFFRLKLCARADVAKCLRYGRIRRESCFATQSDNVLLMANDAECFVMTIRGSHVVSRHLRPCREC